MPVRFNIEGQVLAPGQDAKMNDAIYIQKPEDVINLSPDRETERLNRANKDKNRNKNKSRHRGDIRDYSMDEATGGKYEENDGKGNNNDKYKDNYNARNTGNYYVKEPGSEESLSGDNYPDGTGQFEPNFDDTAGVKEEEDDLPPEYDDNTNLTVTVYRNPNDSLASNRSGLSIPLETSYESDRRIVELDDDGNTIPRERCRIPSKKRGNLPRQNTETENLIQALTKLEIGQELSPDIHPDDEYLTPANHEHIYAEIVDRKIERNITPTGSVNILETERRIRVPILRRITRTFSANRKRYANTNTYAASGSIYRDRNSRLPKTPDEIKKKKVPTATLR